MEVPLPDQREYSVPIVRRERVKSLLRDQTPVISESSKKRTIQNRKSSLSRKRVHAKQETLATLQDRTVAAAKAIRPISPA